MLSERDVIDHLVSKHDPEAIILVGSRSDGRARAGSDWDLYVLLPPCPRSRSATRTSIVS